jgi:hypothetical protein
VGVKAGFKVFIPKTELFKMLLYYSCFNVLITPCIVCSAIVRVIKSRRMRWAGYVARMGREETYTRFWWENLKERDHLVDPGLNRRIILRWIFRKWEVGVWTRLSWLRIETGSRNL